MKFLSAARLELGDSTASVLSELPDDLMLAILAKLPTLNLLQLRSVCRKWKEMISSPPFLRLLSGSPPGYPWYLGFQGFRHEQGWAYDPGSGNWHKLGFSFLPGLTRCAAAAGGLLCFCQDNAQSNSLFVCNPVTRAWRKLPEFPGRIKQVFMSGDTASSSYSVVAVVAPDDSRGGGVVSVLIFDKPGKSWRHASAPARHQQLNFVDGALCGGVLYFLNASVNHEWQFIRTYELRNDVWSDLRVPMPGAFRSSELMSSGFLVEHEGSLLLVEKVISSGGGELKATVGVYELEVGSRDWRAVVGGLEKVTLFVGSFSSRAVRHGGGERSRVYFSNHGSAVNVYDVEGGSWHRLPEFPREKMMATMIVRKPRDRLGVVIPFKGLWFEPRLDSSV